MDRHAPATPAPAPNDVPRAPPNAEGRANQPANENPIPGENRERNTKKRANITIASLNLNGAAAPTQGMNHIDKWATINSTIRTEKIAILALQETHLDERMLGDITRCFGKNFDIVNSSDPGNPRGSAGVAFVVNKALIAPTKMDTYILRQGRAIMLKIKWSDVDEITIINIYAPNNTREQPTFWAQVDLERRTKHLPKPDFLLGDFNITEDPIDRSPPRANDRTAIEALRETRHTWGVQDQWRHDNPTGRIFTFRQLRERAYNHARLDRIYSANRHACNLFEWKAGPSAIPTDHCMVSVKFAPKDAPLIGSGRWTWPLTSIPNDALIDKVIRKGIQVQTRIEVAANTPAEQRQDNPQILWKDFKTELRTIAKKECKSENHKVKTRMRLLEEDIKSVTNNLEIDENETLRTEIAYLTSQLTQLQRKTVKEQREEMRANIVNHGEKPGGIWSAINKEKKPRDLIPRLKIPNTNPIQYERSSARMAELAREYHDSLQSAGIEPETEEGRGEQIQNALVFIPESQHLEEPERTSLNQTARQTHVERAINLSKRGSAAGIDGCPYELWKKLKERHYQDAPAGKPSFDIVKTLTMVYQDIQANGVYEEAEFALGWMCPIYKKKDRTEISNYRPITLLNTDYKLLAKVLALQLMDEIAHLLHPDQTGFVPKRTIFNNIKLASTILNYADLTETDGAIIALDQEKAYDKIRHDYLWETLKEFKIPNLFTNTVKELYKHAHTRVAINGFLSTPFKVTRGVRQGDPLSCALFNLAIEPLACRIRSDDNIKGFEIPGIEEKIIINLYADDTNLFLNKEDSLDYVHMTLEEWCRASGAKFNIGKTEIVPIGKPEHRRQMINTRKLNENDQSPLDERIRIAEDKEAIRILGAWIGNNTDAATPWEPIIDKVQKSLDLYNKSHPTLYGKKTISQMIIGGYTQFLTQAQGMPKHIEDTFVNMTRNFIWEENTSPRIALEYLHYPVEEGGLNLLDLRTRNEAIDIMRVKAYLNMSPDRPIWAKVTDIILDGTAPQGYNAQARMNTFLQTWKVPTQGGRAAKIHKDTMRMLKAARNHNVNFMTIKLSLELKQELPAWFQVGADHWAINNRSAKCLLHKHKAKTMTDLMRASARLRDNPTPAHRPTNYCNCVACAADRRKDCTHPHDCATEALARINRTLPKMNPLGPGISQDNLSLTKRRKHQNRKAREENGKITFDPSVTTKDDLSECFRVFTDPQRLTRNPAQRPQNNGANIRHNEITVYTDGSCTDNGKENAKSGGGAWFGHNDPRNKALRVPGETQSNQTGELAAVIAALQTTPHFNPMEIVSDSRYVIDGLTLHLRKWEDKGWIKIENAALFKKAAFLLKNRSAKTTFRWVKGHNGTLGNEESDKLAKEGAEKDLPDELDLQIPAEFDLQGAKIRTIDQRTAYQGILERKPRPPRPDATEYIQATKQAVEETNGTRETTATIWKSLKKPILRPRIQQFLFKTIHKAYMIGDRWKDVRGSEQRKLCRTCKTVESMQHILLECKVNARKLIWTKAKEHWPQGWHRWPNITLGTILGIGQISLPEIEGQPANEYRATSTKTRGRTRLLQILISEASHLIWVLRCERVIHRNNREHPDQEVNARWLKIINNKLTSDRIIATKIKRDKTFTQLVNATWKKPLENRGIPHRNWLQRREVFSG